jgi:Reverse transcriptase (RNA-dependent DNA polymerase)
VRVRCSTRVSSGTAVIRYLASVISSHGVNHAQYADDAQLYISLPKENDMSKISGCFNAVHQWFAVNGLSLNPGKSEAVVIGTTETQVCS